MFVCSKCVHMDTVNVAKEQVKNSSWTVLLQWVLILLNRSRAKEIIPVRWEEKRGSFYISVDSCLSAVVRDWQVVNHWWMPNWHWLYSFMWFDSSLWFNLEWFQLTWPGKKKKKKVFQSQDSHCKTKRNLDCFLHFKRQFSPGFIYHIL